MPTFLNPIFEAIRSGTGAHLFLALLLAAALLYVWYQHNRAKLLEERIEFTEERRKAAAEDLLAQTKGKDASAADASKVRHSDVNTSNQKSILFVDDELSMHQVMQEVIDASYKNIRVDSALNGEEALESLQKHRPLAIVLDIVMPRKSGFDVLAELARRNENIPIVIASGYFSKKEQLEGRPAPVRSQIEILPKPYDLKALVATLNRLSSKVKEEQVDREPD